MLHSYGVIHSDVVECNIIINDGRATLIDLGNADFTTDSVAQQKDMDAVDQLVD